MKVLNQLLMIGSLCALTFAAPAVGQQNDRAREQEKAAQQAREQKAREEAARKAQEQQVHDRDAAARAKAEEQKRAEEARKGADGKGEHGKEANPRAVAAEIVGLEKVHRERIARINRLMAIYREKKDETRVKELEGMRSAWQKRYENARERLKDRVGAREFERVDHALDAGRRHEAMEKRIENAREKATEKRVDNARDKAQTEKREENAREKAKGGGR